MRLLPGDQRDIVYFRDSCGMSYQQIAKRLGGLASEVRAIYKEEKAKYLREELAKIIKVWYS